MKVKVKHRTTYDDINKVRIETPNIILDINECQATGRITINKVDGVNNNNTLRVYPRYSNEIDVE